MRRPGPCSAARIAAVASRPPISGICTSISTSVERLARHRFHGLRAVVDDGDLMTALGQHRAGDALVDAVVLGQQDASAGVAPGADAAPLGVAAASRAAAGSARRAAP